MLESLKRLHGGTIHLPNRAKDLPDRDRLCRLRPCLTALLARRLTKVGAIALANKIARIAWALLARGGTYRAPQLVAA
jgi:hypothetical protein